MAKTLKGIETVMKTVEAKIAMYHQLFDKAYDKLEAEPQNAEYWNHRLMVLGHRIDMWSDRLSQLWKDAEEQLL